MTKKRTADQWCREQQITILDHDGWRYENGKHEFYHTPITYDEFLYKLSLCTVKYEQEGK